MKVKICINPKCKDNYNLGNGFTKWKYDLKECPTCKNKLKPYETGSLTIKSRS